MDNIECWARLRTNASVPLRRGGWYRVISHTTLEAVVAVEGAAPLSVPRPYLDIRTAKPAEWTVMRNPTVATRTPFAFRRGYLICPGCSERVPLPQSHVQEQLCPRCNHIFPIAWSERYLEDISA